MTVITGKENISRYGVVALRGVLRLNLVGLTSKGMTKTQALAAASRVTGKKYKRGQQDQAVIDVTQWLEDNPWT